MTLPYSENRKAVISRFVKAFDMPHESEYLGFWNRIVHEIQGGCRPSYLGGWATAFVAFDEDGKWIGHSLVNESYYSEDLASLSASDFFAKHTRKNEIFLDPFDFVETPKRENIVLDGVPYHYVTSDKIPNGYAEVDVTIDDNGVTIPSKMVAGHVGIQISSSGDMALSSTGERDTVGPVAGWWIFSTLSEDKIPRNTLYEYDDDDD